SPRHRALGPATAATDARRSAWDSPDTDAYRSKKRGWRQRERASLWCPRECSGRLHAQPTVKPPRHVIVCGAGVMGASVAFFLAGRAVPVTVVERRGVACAASGKSGGFLALDWCDGSPLGPLARASFALHAVLPRELVTDYGYRRVDTFMLAASERGAA